MKKLPALLSIGIVLAVIAHVTLFKESTEVVSSSPADTQYALLTNSTFTVDGRTITLKDGSHEESAAPGSASKVKTAYFGNVAYGDLTFDGTDDVAFLVTQSTGGSGLFYYVVVGMREGDTYTMTNAFLIGDRVAPQTTEIRSNELYVNFAERLPDEPMTAQPSIGATLALKVTKSGVLEGLMK